MWEYKMLLSGEMANIRLRMMETLLCEYGGDEEINICTSFGMPKAGQTG